jgi:hypothetical protein
MNSKLVVNGYELELSENIAVPLNLSITDIKEPEKRKRSFSKTITLEGTSNNMNFFIGAYALELRLVDSTNIQFTPNLRYDCEFFKNDLLIFKGKFKLNDVKIVDGGYTFDCNLISEAVDIFAKLKDKKLNELNWSEYDHELYPINITRSWSSQVYVNNVLTRNFGADSLGYQPKSFGYIYPLVDYGYNKPANNSSGSFRANQLYPFIYVKEALKKTLNYALEGTNIEVDYTTTFFENANMKKLIYGFGGGEQIKFNSDQINASRVLIDNATKNYVVSAKNNGGSYVFGSQFDFLKDFSYTHTSNVNTLSKPQGAVTVNLAGKYTLNFSSEIVYYSSVPGGVNLNVPQDNTIVVYVDGVVSYTYKWRQNLATITTVSFNTTLDVKPGQKVKLELTIQGASSSNGYTNLQYFTLNFTNTDFELVADKEAPLTDGSIVSLSSAIPDIKCSDFLKGILNLFYAYMSDPIYNPTTNKSTIYIDSFVNFYDNQSDYDNWTSLVDNSKDITIQSNSLVEGNIYAYKFSEEKDKFNNEYKLITGSNYGEKQINIDTWLNGVVKFELPFATYPTVKPEGKNFVYPIVINEESKPYKGKGMLCFYNGLRQADVNIYNCANDTNLLKNFYPFTHHIRFQDNQNNIPLFDLHFSPRQFAFDSIYVVPNLNTFEVYHKKFLNEITSIDSKLVTLYLKLTYKDINELDFAKLKMIDGVLYRLNTIKDFDSDAYGTTEVELIKFLG